MTHKTTWIAVAVFVSSNFLMEPAAAVGSMRCGTHIISATDRRNTDKFEVLKKCGEPTNKYGNTWTYNLPGGATRVVYFDANGNVARIN